VPPVCHGFALTAAQVTLAQLLQAPAVQVAPDLGQPLLEALQGCIARFGSGAAPVILLVVEALAGHAVRERGQDARGAAEWGIDCQNAPWA
jgi:hypothetical protein